MRSPQVSGVLVTVEPPGRGVPRPDLTDVGTFGLRRAIHRRRERGRGGEGWPQPSAWGPATFVTAGPFPRAGGG